MPGEIRKRPSTSSTDEDFISLEKRPTLDAAKTRRRRSAAALKSPAKFGGYIPITPLMAAEAAKRQRESESQDEEDASSDKDGSRNPEETPWARESGYTVDVIGLHHEIRDFFRFIEPTAEEKRMRKQVVRRITDVIKGLWPQAKVEIFGSYETGLYLPTSDIDVVVFGRWPHLPLRTLEKAFVEAGIAESHGIQVIDKASVPIIKVIDEQTEVRVDISFNMPNSVHAVQLVKRYMQEFPTLKYLVFVLKQFLSQRDLNEVYFGGVSSYSLVLMTISFLQLHPRPDAHSFRANLGVLLLEFFELYGIHFNYGNVCIRVKDGGSYLPKAEFYRKEVGQKCPEKGLCIEDPYTQGNDISRGSYHSDRVAAAFEKAFYALQYAVLPDRKRRWKGRTRSLLLNILQLNPELVSYRGWIKENF